MGAPPTIDRGSFTAELAAGMPALILLLSLGLAAVAAVTTRMQCVDAAREAAIASSRGEPGEPAGVRAAPLGATVSVAISGEKATATVTAPVRLFRAPLPALTATATAVAAVERGWPGAAP